METGMPIRALGIGAIGALTLTSLNETARRFSPKAPRLEQLGERGLAKMFGWKWRIPPRRKQLYRWALAGELLINSLYYALVALRPGRRPLLRGTLMGTVMGLGALVLPQRLGLGRGPTALSSERKAMTVAWYALGGLAAGATSRALVGLRA